MRLRHSQLLLARPVQALIASIRRMPDFTTGLGLAWLCSVCLNSQTTLGQVDTTSPFTNYQAAAPERWETHVPTVNPSSDSANLRSAFSIQPGVFQPGELFAEDESAVASQTASPAWYAQRDLLAFGNHSISAPRPTLAGRLLSDQLNFYSAESLTLLGSGLIVGGVLANSSIDADIQRHFQSSIRNANSDDWFESLHSSKELGNGKYTLPVFAGAWVLGNIFPESEFTATAGTWGERSIRGFLVGAPPLLALQQLTGGARPTENDEGSEWRPLQDNNGISGHSFMGSLPFITAAKMTESRGLKTVYYAASTLAPLSRMNDNAHYPSQVALGWWMAYLAASAVDVTDHPDARWKFYPYSSADGSGFLAEYRF